MVFILNHSSCSTSTGRYLHDAELGTHPSSHGSPEQAASKHPGAGDGPHSDPPLVTQWPCSLVSPDAPVFGHAHRP